MELNLSKFSKWGTIACYASTLPLVISSIWRKGVGKNNKEDGDVFMNESRGVGKGRVLIFYFLF